MRPQNARLQYCHMQDTSLQDENSPGAAEISMCHMYEFELSWSGGSAGARQVTGAFWNGGVSVGNVIGEFCNGGVSQTRLLPQTCLSLERLGLMIAISDITPQ
ncbi:hypothetical protein AAFF_G00136780 [Aldrovandia affinis]|uniref:Uncharacterized protein n=1 Tax=Aldrovandia affinis TaxID=143900 RepID=A0AAD7TBL5_9TELE|nr:hypothetical protein AAFF_G00136780 [Aldrovandia affinis]